MKRKQITPVSTYGKINSYQNISKDILNSEYTKWRWTIILTQQYDIQKWHKNHQSNPIILDKFIKECPIGISLTSLLLPFSWCICYKFIRTYYTEVFNRADDSVTMEEFTDKTLTELLRDKILWYTAKGLLSHHGLPKLINTNGERKWVNYDCYFFKTIGATVVEFDFDGTYTITIEEMPIVLLRAWDLME